MPNRYLALETSSARLSLALGDETHVIARYQGPLQWRHAEMLFNAMAQLLKKAKWPVSSLTGVAVSIGPGSFTGIRIGLAAARALGQALAIPVVGINSLETVAAGAKTTVPFLCPRLDALRGQFFSALYHRGRTGRLKRIWPEAIVENEAWLRRVQQKTKNHVWVSSPADCYPDAADLLSLARPRLLQARKDSYKSVQPLYLRAPAAVERRRA